MRSFLKVAVFSLAVIAFFAGYSNFGIPPIEPAPPPADEALDLSAMTMDRFVALGERVYNGKGTCTLCHDSVGGRAPPLESAAVVAAERLADTRYQGTATTAAEYLYESMVAPSAFVVAGFGKTGSDDTVSPMPDVSGGGIGLSEAEIAAVIAYLQDLGGVPITVAIPAEAGAEEAEPSQRQPFATAEEVIGAFACGACHKVAGEEGELGPDLTGVGGRRDAEFIRRAILDPNADITEGFEPDTMPADYGAQLYAGELELLVDYLTGLQ